MSLWDGIFGRRRVNLSHEDPTNWNFGQPSHAGKSVTPDTTMSLSSAWACIRLRHRVSGALPVGVYERGPDGERIPATDHWLYHLLHESPNADQTPSEWMGGAVSCLDLHGNAYALKRYVGDKVVSVEPLRPDFMKVDRNTNGVRVYSYSGPRFRGTYTEKDILHLRGFTLGGDVGLSAVSFGRHSLGIALAADETAGKTFANGLQVSGFVKLPAGTKADKAQKQQLVDLFDKFTGSSRAGKVMPLDGGMEFSPLDMKPEDAQLLESRSFSVEEICRWFDTPPILIGHAGEGQTMWGSGIEQIMLAWLATGLDPLLVSIEQALEKQMLSPAERRRYYVEFTREGLLRADSKARAEFYNKVFGVGAITPNQIADRENLPRFEGGDVRFVNAVYVPVDEAGRGRVQPPAAGPV